MERLPTSKREMKKLPLTIDNQLFLRSAEQKAIRTISKILGARHGDFILIEEPVFRLSERLYATPKEILCSFADEGDLYHFQSKIQTTIGKGLTFIDYPEDFEVEALRKYHRIQVNIEVALHLRGMREPVKAVMKDISEGGCYINLHSLVSVTQNMQCKIDFTLPDNQIITGLIGEARAVKFSKLRKTTDFGLEFTGPPEELAKIQSFCRYCMFFKV
jgi:c-di-GMP-binding flagellar brake protein YcgR